MKKFTLSLIALLAASVANADVTLKYSDHEPYGNMRTRFIQDVFFKAVEEESQGKIKIDAHWGGELANPHHELEALAEKKADLIVAVPEYSEKQLPLHQLFKSFPVGPSGAEQVKTIRQIYQELPELTAEYEQNGAKPLIIATGYPYAFLSAKEVDKISDIKGQTWRSNSFWQRFQIEKVGATAVKSPWGDIVREKLASGEWNGLIVNIDSALDVKANEPAPYALISDKLWLGHIYPVVMNLESWQKLSKDEQQAFERAAEKAYTQLGTIMSDSYQAILKQAREQGMTVRELSDEEVAQWATLTQFPQYQADWIAEQKKAGVKADFDKVLAVLTRHLTK